MNVTSRASSQLLRTVLPALSTLFLVLACSPAAAQSAENVAVVINDNSPASQRVGEYYIRARAIPTGNVFRIRTTADEIIDRATFAATIERPLAAAISRAGLQDRILYIVLTKGTPLRIAGTDGLQGTVSSVDSELTLLYRRMTGNPAPIVGRTDNPYFLGTRPPGEIRPFTHRDYDVYLVTRLDGFTVEDALKLVDRALVPVKEGRIVLDQQDKLFNRTGEDWLEEASKRLEAQGHGDRVMLETTVKGVRDVRPVLGYYSWGSNDPRNRTRSFGMGFVPGAIAGMFVSSDARTFKEPPAAWLPTSDAERAKFYAGTPQSLIGDLIREGVTGVSGHVIEPYLQSTVRPEILFPAYLSGLNLAESFYTAMPHLSWQNLVIGDPLCAPFRQRALTRSDLGDGVDPDTLLPQLFSGRRQAFLKPMLPAGVNEAVLKLTARADGLIARDDLAAARMALEEATRLAPHAAYAHLQLAILYEQDAKFDAAVERYRLVVDIQPRNAIALNNLAYTLATRQKAPAEALRLAERAVAVSPQNSGMIDTLAWIEHLLGDDATAAKRISLAVQGAPNNAAVRLHAAVIYAAIGSTALADAELKAALQLNPSLGDSAEVKSLRAQLEKAAR